MFYIRIYVGCEDWMGNKLIVENRIKKILVIILVLVDGERIWYC